MTQTTLWLVFLLQFNWITLIKVWLIHFFSLAALHNIIPRNPWSPSSLPSLTIHNGPAVSPVLILTGGKDGHICCSSQNIIFFSFLVLWSTKYPLWSGPPQIYWPRECRCTQMNLLSITSTQWLSWQKSNLKWRRHLPFQPGTCWWIWVTCNTWSSCTLLHVSMKIDD